MRIKNKKEGFLTFAALAVASFILTLALLAFIPSNNAQSLFKKQLEDNAVYYNEKSAIARLEAILQKDISYTNDNLNYEDIGVTFNLNETEITQQEKTITDYTSSSSNINIPIYSKTNIKIEIVESTLDLMLPSSYNVTLLDPNGATIYSANKEVNTSILIENLYDEVNRIGHYGVYQLIIEPTNKLLEIRVAYYDTITRSLSVTNHDGDTKSLLVENGYGHNVLTWY